MFTRRFVVWVLLVTASTGLRFAQTHPAPHVHAPSAPAAPATALPGNVPSNQDVAAIQRQLIELLRLSPTLTTVVARDPSLLANQEYVSRNNPQLAEFLAAHPEVTRNPDFYLFTHMRPNDGSPDEALEHEVWPEMYRRRFGGDSGNSGFQDMLRNLPPVFGIGLFLAAVVWAIRLIVESRRWSRVFKLQSEVHGRLIDKFSSSQELAAYMETEAGRRFLEAAPISLDVAPQQRVPNAVARVLTPLQIGVVLVLLGAGFLLLRNIGTEYHVPMRVLGVLVLMPGIGFILSAGLTWVLASRLGLMPPSHPEHIDASFSERP